MKFHFKPIGTTDSNINRDYDIHSDIYFSKHSGGKPKLSNGDWLFLYATGLRKMIGVSLITGDNALVDSEDPRFVYKTKAQLILPTFSTGWYDHNVNPIILDDGFTQKTGHNVTYENDSLSGALQRQNTCFGITKEFAMHLLSEMVKYS